MSALIDAYEYARHLVVQGMSIEDATRNDELETIKWTHTLKQSLKNNEEIEFDETRIRNVLYRPFTKLWLYEDHRILSQPRPPPTSSRGLTQRQPGGGGARSHLLGITQQPVTLRSDRDRLSRRPMRSRDEPASASHPTEAIMLTGPSNMAVFGTLATDRLPDLHLMGPGQQTRALPRRRRSC